MGTLSRKERCCPNHGRGEVRAAKRGPVRAPAESRAESILPAKSELQEVYL